ncbi:MAG: SF3a splicing factor complex subunit [Trizodia sp. TS-e1964]|nr:MAG: SF3a splicing factor complex subunit [Trizodia sp. TS-e1964]
MAPSPTAVNDHANGLDLEGKLPPGVVLPPREIQAIVEKTAGYVARNGNAFEDRIKEKEKHNPKFCFFSPNDAYNAFYSWRLSEVRAGRGTDVSAGRVGEASVEVVPEKPKGPPEPAEFKFSARMPNINALDLEVVKLTALFVAKNGRQFMTGLSQRESGNYQFDFLRPNHSLYQFFSRLVDQYTELFRATGVDGEGGKIEAEITKGLEENVRDRLHILGRAKGRAEWIKFQDKQKLKKEEAEQHEQLIYAQIDWHDFVLAETVIFDETDDVSMLPAPTSLSDLQFASLEEKAMMSLQPHNMRIEEAAPEEMTYYNPYAPQQYAMEPPPPPQQNNNTSYAPPDETADEDQQRIEERAMLRSRAQQAQAEARGGIAPLKIRNDYVPRAAALAANRRNVAKTPCPNCKQMFAFDELEAHMKIELLDPAWKEQKAKSESRYATTNLSTIDVATNLKRLASQRSDVFDSVNGAPELSEDEAKRRKKASTGYDGQPDAARLQNVNVEEQIRQIYQKFGERK